MKSFLALAVATALTSPAHGQINLSAMTDYAGRPRAYLAPQFVPVASDFPATPAEATKPKPATRPVARSRHPAHKARRRFSHA